MLPEGALSNYYMETYELRKVDRFSLVELENMYPFERSIYIQLIIAELKQKAEDLKHG